MWRQTFMLQPLSFILSSMSKSPLPKNNVQPNGAPRWETWTMAASFVVLWVWFIARQLAFRAGEVPSALWQIPLIISVVVLALIFVRRMKRALLGLKEIHPARRGKPGHN